MAGIIVELGMLANSGIEAQDADSGDMVKFVLLGSE